MQELARRPSPEEGVMIRKESAAWREVARVVAERGESNGLCVETCYLRAAGVISWGLERQMDSRTRAHKYRDREWSGGMHWVEPGRATAPLRVLAALFLALEAADEGR
jgi:hypothetical protein